MKKILSALLACTLLLSCLALPALADGEGGPAPGYAGKTVILYTGNIRGDLDVYPRIAAMKKQYEENGAAVLLADVGNYLQGTAAANSDRGLTVYALMDAAGYDVAGLGLAEFGYTDATTGYLYHGNFTRYYTQAMLQDGTEAVTYSRDKDGKETAVLPAKAPAKLRAVCSNVAPNAAYSFERAVDLTPEGGLTVRFFGLADPAVAERVQDGYVELAEPIATLDNFAGVAVTLSNDPDAPAGDLVIRISPEDGFTCGALVVDDKTLAVERESFDLSGVEGDEGVAALVDAARAQSVQAVGESEVILEGRDSQNRNGETNLGDLTCDALKWYAETYMDGVDLSLPVVALQNGGNCDQFLYTGEICETDLLRALPFSPMGIGVLQITGAQLLETLEAACQCENSAGFAQVAGLCYTLNAAAGYDAGEAYGKFYRCSSINRVAIDSVGGAPFDPGAVYNLVADNYVLNGNDTFYTLKEAKEAGSAKYVNNGPGVKTRDVVALYIQEVLGGAIGSEYEQPQGRISVTACSPEAAAWVSERELTAGWDFRPLEDCTRAQAVTMLWRAAGSPVVDCLMPFSDVDQGADYAEAVRWAAGEGIVNGVSGDLFAPGRAVTREEAAAILYRYLKTQGGGFTGSWMFPLQYEDAAEISEWADEAAHYVSMKALIAPKSGNRLDPRGAASQGVVVTMLHGALAGQDAPRG